jgi:hypothetical protein
MLHDQGDNRSKDGGNDNHCGYLELQGRDKGQQPDLDRIELEVRADNVNHPKDDYRGADHLGALEESRQLFASNLMVAKSGGIVK